MKSYKYDRSCFTRFYMSEYPEKHYRLFSSFTQLWVCCTRPSLFSFAGGPCFWIYPAVRWPFSVPPSGQQTAYLLRLINCVSSTSLIFAFTAPIKFAFFATRSSPSNDREALYFYRVQIGKFPTSQSNYCVLCIEIVTGEIFYMSKFFLSLQLAI